MKHTGYTPGPWKSNEKKQGYYDQEEDCYACAVWSEDGETPICTTRFSVGKYNEVDAKTRDANTRLIASAPDLAARIVELEHLAHDVESTLSACLNPDGSWEDMPAAYKRSLLVQARALLVEKEETA